MAILFSQADGSDQHYDTYEEFEQAFILLKRLNGEKVPQDLLDEAKAKNGGKEGVEGSTYTINVDTSMLTEKIDEEIAKLKRAEPLGKDANGEDLFEGDYVTGVEDSQYSITSPNAICEVESDSVVKLIQTTDEIFESRYEGESFAHIDLKDFVKLSDNLDEAKAKFDELNGEELEVSSTGFRTGDIVKVTKTFEDSHGDKAHGGEILEYDDAWPKTFVGLVFVEDNLDKLQLVCRKEDRKDTDL